jgi:hypothetical protein
MVSLICNQTYLAKLEASTGNNAMKIKMANQKLKYLALMMVTFSISPNVS